MFNPVFSDDNFIGILTHSIDVNEQLESQRKLEKREEKYRLLANSGEALIAVFDSNYCCTFINEPFVNFSGITEERALGKAVDRFMIPDTEALSQFKALFTWPRKKEFEVQFPSSDNSLHWTRCLCTPLYDNDEFNGMLVQAYVIHKRKTIELALEQNERQYRDLANSGETLVWVADKNNIINYANQLLSDFSNVPIDSIVGSKTPMRYHHEDSIRVAKEFYNLPLAQKKLTI